MCSATNVGQSRTRIACLILGKLLLYLRLFSEYYFMTVYENRSYHQDKCRVGKRISKDTISCQFKLSQGRIEDNRYTVYTSGGTRLQESADLRAPAIFLRSFSRLTHDVLQD
jgi:hypothetical protein